MKNEWTLEQIREFVKKDYQSVAARMTKCLLSYYDEVVNPICPKCKSKDITKGADTNWCNSCGEVWKINTIHSPTSAKP